MKKINLENLFKSEAEKGLSFWQIQIVGLRKSRIRLFITLKSLKIGRGSMDWKAEIFIFNLMIYWKM